MVWKLPLKFFRTSGVNRKLHEGSDTHNEEESLVIIMESFGSENDVNYITYKQVINSSDFLKSIICKYKLGSLKRLINFKIPCVSVIENRLTFCLTSVHSKTKWKFVEARPCIIPTVKAEKKQWIKVFEFQDLLRHVVKETLSEIDGKRHCTFVLNH